MPADKETSLTGKCALVTGASRRIGAAIARCLHGDGAKIAIHYRGSANEARLLKESLGGLRTGSAEVFQADLRDIEQLTALVASVVRWAGRLDILVNNASVFYPTPLGSITEEQWSDLAGSNLRAPLFLSQAAWPHLRETGGTIVNMIDIHAQRPLRDHALYGASKAGLAMLTRALAKDMAPEVRVNGISPGAILWPESGMTEPVKANIVEQIPLQRPGEPADIARSALYLVRDATYVTGQVIAVDGGRSIGW